VRLEQVRLEQVGVKAETVATALVELSSAFASTTFGHVYRHQHIERMTQAGLSSGQKVQHRVGQQV